MASGSLTLEAPESAPAARVAPGRPRLKAKVPILVFARCHLGLRLYPWQQDLLCAIEAGHPVASVICNNGGKTSVVIAVATLWFLYNWPRGRMPIISGSWNQVETQLWPALEGFRSHACCTGWDFKFCEIRTPQGGFARGMSPDDPRKAEGYHSSPGSPVFYLIDEAKGVSDGVFAAVGRCTLDFLALMSSAGPAAGFFYSAFNRHRSAFWTLKVTSYDCPHISEETRERDRVQFNGEGSPVYRSKHLSEFDEETTGAILPLESLGRALAHPPVFQPGARSGFLDFAAGGDENVLALKDGNRVTIVAAWREKDTVQACRTFLHHFSRLNLTPGELSGDGDGLGSVMLDVLAEQGWHLARIHNGLPAKRDQMYANLGSEIWFDAAAAIERGELILPDDAQFVEQATTRRRQYDARARLRAEPKDQMAARGIPSPDRADAALGAIVCRQPAWTVHDVKASRVPQNPFARAGVTFR